MLARVSDQEPGDQDWGDQAEPTQPLRPPGWNHPPVPPPPTRYLPQPPYPPAQPPVPYAQQPSPPYGPPPGYYAQPPAPYGRPMVPMVVAPKSPGLSLLASFFVPGLGSMINGDGGKGAGILIGYIVSLFFVLIVIGIFGVIGFWVWGMVDAYQGARNWNLRHGILS